MNADSNAPKLAKPSARCDVPPPSLSDFSAAHGDALVDAQQSSAASTNGSSDIVLLLFHDRSEAMFFHCGLQLFDCNPVGTVANEQQVQIQIVNGDHVPFKLVFNRLDTFKLYQSFLDLVRSVASHDL